EEAESAAAPRDYRERAAAAPRTDEAPRVEARREHARARQPRRRLRLDRLARPRGEPPHLHRHPRAAHRPGAGDGLPRQLVGEPPPAPAGEHDRDRHSDGAWRGAVRRAPLPADAAGRHRRRPLGARARSAAAPVPPERGGVDGSDARCRARGRAHRAAPEYAAPRAERGRAHARPLRRVGAAPPRPGVPDGGIGQPAGRGARRGAPARARPAADRLPRRPGAERERGAVPRVRRGAARRGAQAGARARPGGALRAARAGARARPGAGRRGGVRCGVRRLGYAGDPRDARAGAARARGPGGRGH
ncbi:MAG: hypothetical protein AVDCRST_MAG11-1527, partial [uncultured Gemmatimonadaceae bacterium]